VSGLSGACLNAVQNSTVVLEESQIVNNYQPLKSTDGLFYVNSGIFHASGLLVADNVVASNGIFGLYSVESHKNC
jgi:hypothetical protein